MNFLHGMVAGFYLTLLGSLVQQQYRGRVFGFGYAVGIVGTWILSLIFGRDFLSTDSVVIAYIINNLYSPAPITENERKKLLYEAFEKKYALSRRESEVFRLVAQGLSNPEIGGVLYVSESTFKYHVGNILKKAGCSNRSELILRFKSN